jgi:hypothetical protein
MSLVTTLLAAGPTVLRLIGKATGGKTEFAAEKIAELIDGKPGKPTEASMQAMVKSLDPLAIQELSVSLAQIEADKQKAALDHDLGMHQAQQDTIQSVDIKGVRPEIANRHSWFTAIYLFAFEAGAAFGYGTGANWEVATLLAAPTLAWFGFRTWDKFSKQGASK